MGARTAGERLIGLDQAVRETERALADMRRDRNALALHVHGQPWCNHDGPPRKVCECGEVLR